MTDYNFLVSVGYSYAYPYRNILPCCVCGLPGVSDGGWLVGKTEAPEVWVLQFCEKHNYLYSHIYGGLSHIGSRQDANYHEFLASFIRTERKKRVVLIDKAAVAMGYL